MHSEYVGKERPQTACNKSQDSSRLDGIFDKFARNLDLAVEIFGTHPDTFAEGKKHYRAVAGRLHPDRNVGDDGTAFKRFVAAWEYIKFFYDWS